MEWEEETLRMSSGGVGWLDRDWVGADARLCCAVLVISRQWAHVHFHIDDPQLVTAWKHSLESLLLWGLLAWEGHGRSGAAISHVPFFCAVLYPLPVHGDV